MCLCPGNGLGAAPNSIPVRAVAYFRSQHYRARCCPAAVAPGVPPAGKELIQRSSSSGGYRTSDPTFRKHGPRRSSRHRRKHARLTRSRSATSSSVNRGPLTRLAPTFLNPGGIVEALIAAHSLCPGPTSATGSGGVRCFMKRSPSLFRFPFQGQRSAPARPGPRLIRGSCS
jgi:hypothetical protein